MKSRSWHRQQHRAHRRNRKQLTLTRRQQRRMLAKLTTSTCHEWAASHDEPAIALSFNEIRKLIFGAQP